MSIHFNNDWENPIQQELHEDYYLRLRQFLIKEYKTRVVYPPMGDIFNAFHLTSLNNTKVCIIGQDPYHGPNQAHGLSFSVKPGLIFRLRCSTFIKNWNQIWDFPSRTTAV